MNHFIFCYVSLPSDQASNKSQETNTTNVAQTNISENGKLCDSILVKLFAIKHMIQFSEFKFNLIELKKSLSTKSVEVVKIEWIVRQKSEIMFLILGVILLLFVTSCYANQPTPISRFYLKETDVKSNAQNQLAIYPTIDPCIAEDASLPTVFFQSYNM